MNINFERKAVNNCYINIRETPGAIFGFTEFGFSREMLMREFDIRPSDLLELKQVHSDIIRFSHQMEPGGEKEEGDGIILTEPSRLAIIKTADCTPLFFWSEPDGQIISYETAPSPPAGVIHIGWRGLHAGIEQKLLKTVLTGKINPKSLYFYLGPAIEGTCYEVGAELYRDFRDKHYRDRIFTSIGGRGEGKDRESTELTKYLLDIRKGIRLSLQASGVPAENIFMSSICTYCESGRIPSYRRAQGTGERILNFLIQK